MLRRKIILIIGFVLLVVGGCDVLDQSPKQSISSSQVFTSEANVRAVLAGAYSGLQGQIPFQYRMAALAGETVKHSGSYPSWGAVDNHTMLSSNAEARDLWDGFYAVILRVNNLIANTSKVEDTGFTQEEKATVVAEAKVIRAICYHALVRFYGGVPLVLEPIKEVNESIFVSRASKEAVYDQIIKDLTDAVATLGANGSAGATTVTGLAATALLSRVYLYTGQYDLAEQAATTVIGSGKYKLPNDYAANWAGASTEEIFTLLYTTEDGNALAFFAFPSTAGGRYEYAPSTGYVGTYESGDERLDVNVGVVDASLTITKYFRTVNGDDDVTIIRLAEVYLNRAEARANQNDITEAMADVNKVRDRAGLGDKTASNKADALDIILQERAHELFVEGTRWFDLRRFGVAQEVFNIDANDLLWPIPQSEIDTNPNLEQNPGY